ncbi:WD repeat protein [Talaromyces stipitatus ATCC 10500]|uniref:Probable cytosolic iron-sulfur protein assembly protein 1 n=1 Tax=Talaromyces stipitatus (strain ATCC 10500 / CBS 375.48 / QM 6759 / NRRL 1006) TaxID=441959 RepID=B8M723_TALSN|nr:WD repeat protein [Talaromyces stipitatus ATCC 10500]EED20243.1 WD repeat protein [Talaromyces stipitatus ATCC 10500]
MWKISLVSDLTPPSLERIWQSSPHPTLPLVATSSADKTVRIYSLVNYKLLSIVSGGHKRSIRSSAWKPTPPATTGSSGRGESVLATGSFDATVGIWRRWDDYNNHNNDTGAEEGKDDDDEDEEWRFAVLLDGHDSEVKSVSWSASGSLLATCSRDKSIWIWEDLDDGDNNFETVAVLQEHTADVKCVAWHPVEECLASGSYDDTIRVWREDIDDWGQVACLKGHGGTVWFVDWEGVDYAPFTSTTPSTEPDDDQSAKIKEKYREHYRLSGPRIVSCSSDKTVRIWRRQAKQAQISTAFSASTTGIPSIIRPTGLDETWHQDATLPAAHDLAIYAVAWSKRSGLIASTGADGRIVVYTEEFVDNKKQKGNDEEMDTSPDTPFKTEWRIVASIEAAHGIYEVNHIAWAKRGDRRGEQKEDEMLISTGDDGSVKEENRATPNLMGV